MLILKSKKVILRDWKTDDFALFREYQNPKYLWHQFDGPYYPSWTEEEIENAIDKRRKMIETDFPKIRTDLVIADKASNRLIGRVSSYWKSRETNWLEFGISIYDDKKWGKGLGQDALGLWIGYLLKTRPSLVRIGFSTWSGNKGMIKLGENLGLKQEACIRKARIYQGKYYDSLSYGILREEWEENSRK